jgi:hypothetical protein
MPNKRPDRKTKPRRTRVKLLKACLTVHAKPKRKPPRPYFARLDPRRDLTEQIAARIVQYLAAESDESGRVVYMVLYHSVHGERYRDWNGRDLWAEALKYLAPSIRRECGFIWLDCETTVVCSLPWPYKPEPKFKPAKENSRQNGTKT